MNTKKTEQYTLGIDMGGTKVELALMDLQGRLIDRQRMPTEASRGLAPFLSSLENLTDKLLRDNNTEKDSILGVGAGTPGTYFPEKDQLIGAPHTLFYEEKGFISTVKKYFQNYFDALIPFEVENDANCLVISEYLALPQRYDAVLGLIMGTGVGAGLILKGELYRGPEGQAAEIGHTIIIPEGRQCQCGKKGCLEAYLSGKSIERQYFELTGEKVDAEKIYKKYEEGENQAVTLMNQLSMLLAQALSNMVNMLDLEGIILGGGVSNMSLWYDRLPKLMDPLYFNGPRKVFVKRAEGGDSSGVRGAAYLPLRTLKLVSF